MSTGLFDLAARQHGVVSRRQAAALGARPSTIRQAVRRGQLRTVGVHVLRATGAPATWRQQVLAAVLDAPDNAVASHITAAALWRLPGFGERRPHVTVRHSISHRRSPLATVHLTRDLPDNHVGVVDEIPVTSPARTLFDLAACIRAGRLARAIDTAVGMRLTTYGELCAIGKRLAVQGRDGSTLFREVMSARDEGEVPTESELEARFLDLVDRYGLPQPERQIVLGDDAEAAGRVDFYFREAGLVVELDGRRHHSSLLDREADAKRDLVLMRSGRRVLRLTWAQVTQRPWEVADAITRMVA